MKHRVGLAQTFAQQFVEHRGKIFLGHLKSPYVLGFGGYPLARLRAEESIATYENRYLKVIKYLEEGLEDSLSYYAFP